MSASSTVGSTAMPSPTASALPSSPASSAPPRRMSRSTGHAPPISPYPQYVDPSPTDSNGTDGTEIDDDSQEEASAEGTPDPTLTGDHPGPATSELTRISTDIPNRSRSSSDDAPLSVIRLTSGFLNSRSPAGITSATQATLAKRERCLGSPTTPDAALGPDDKRMSVSSQIIDTSPPIGESMDRATPRAHTLQEAEEEVRSRLRTSSHLQDIPESLALSDHAQDNTKYRTMAMSSLNHAEPGMNALRSALVECWTLCNTLANLSSQHRQRVFVLTSSNGLQEHAWQSCWRLCQKLYSETYSLPATDPRSTLDLCRDFCQALFEVRQRGDEATDSVLRVSFEMNNHLYNTHDRQLPPPFLERTLEFYITLCHRMMKQQTVLSQETDCLLRACWTLAEMLFNLRQTTLGSNTPDEDLLGSAVQACWDLCDLFREGWTQVRPERRSTPRPTQSNASGRGSRSIHSTGTSSSLSNNSSYHDATPAFPPETPVTIFDDTASASSHESSSMPNILVLGPANNINNTRGMLARGTHHDRWSSNASTLSGYSESASASASSKRSSSTATASTQSTHLLRLQYLILKAAMHAGFARASAQPISTFVRGLSADAFGPLPWQKQVLQHFKSLIEADASLRALNNLPSKRLTARETAKAVEWLAREDEWVWMRDLYRLLFEFGTDEAPARGQGVHLQV